MIRAWIAGVITGAGRIRAHAPGVRPLIVIAQPLVILRRGERQHMPPVHHHDERRFLAGQEFLDHHARTGRAQRLADQHGVDRLVRLGHRSAPRPRLCPPRGRPP
jgi:hypothetical protein